MSIWRKRTYKLFRETKTRAISFTSALVLTASSLGGALPLVWSNIAGASASASITYPTSPVTLVSGASITVTGSAHDASKHRAFVYSSSPCTGTPIASTADISTQAFSVTVSGLNAGTYNLYVMLNKYNGNGGLNSTELNCVALPAITVNAPVPPVNHAPGVPVLAAPANGIVRQGDYTLPTTNQSSWNASTDPDGDAVTYIYQSAYDAAFANTAYTSSALTDTFILNPSEPEGTYYWHVKAVDSLGLASDWSTAWSITIDNTAPGVPTLLSPANGLPVSGVNLVNDWSDVDGTDHYVYQSYNVDGGGNCNLSDIRWTENYTASNTNTRNVGDLTFCWRVKAVDAVGNESAWSDLWKTVTDSTAPGVPTLLFPADNALQNFNDFWFDWTDVDGTDHYEFQASQSPSVDGEGSLDVGVWSGDASHIQPTDSTAHSVGANGTWYWQVRAVDAANNKSAWTVPFKVTIDLTAPTTPSITTPTDGQYFTATPILNAWTAAADDNGIATYQVAYRYDDGHTFGGSTCTGMLIGGQPVSGCRDETTLQRNHVPASSEQGGVIIWVRAQDNAGNWSDWSTPVHYIYDATAPTVPTNGQPNAIFKNTNAFNYTWDGSTDNVGPITYEYQASQNPAESGGILTTSLWQNWVSGDASQYPLTNPLIPSVGTSDGTWYWQVRAVDAAGNRSAWSTIWNYTLDSQAPQVTINSFGQTNNVIQPSITAHDPAPGTALSFLWDEHTGVTVSDPSALNPTFTVTIDGTYTFHLTVTDQAGNSTTVPFTFTYTTPPSGGFGGVTTDNGTPTTPAPQTLADNNTGTNTPPVTSPQILGDSTNDPSSNVEGDSTINSKDVATINHGKFLGLGWWWLAILAALGLAWLILAASRRKDEEGQQG